MTSCSLCNPHLVCTTGVRQGAAEPGNCCADSGRMRVRRQEAALSVAATRPARACSRSLQHLTWRSPSRARPAQAPKAAQKQMTCACGRACVGQRSPPCTAAAAADRPRRRPGWRACGSMRSPGRPRRPRPRTASPAPGPAAARASALGSARWAPAPAPPALASPAQRLRPTGTLDCGKFSSALCTQLACTQINTSARRTCQQAHLLALAHQTASNCQSDHSLSPNSTLSARARTCCPGRGAGRHLQLLQRAQRLRALRAALPGGVPGARARYAERGRHAACRVGAPVSAGLS